MPHPDPKQPGFFAVQGLISIRHGQSWFGYFRLD